MFHGLKEFHQLLAMVAISDRKSKAAGFISAKRGTHFELSSGQPPGASALLKVQVRYPGTLVNPET